MASREEILAGICDDNNDDLDRIEEALQKGLVSLGSPVRMRCARFLDGETFYAANRESSNCCSRHRDAGAGWLCTGGTALPGPSADAPGLRVQAREPCVRCAGVHAALVHAEEQPGEGHVQGAEAVLPGHGIHKSHLPAEGWLQFPGRPGEGHPVCGMQWAPHLHLPD